MAEYSLTERVDDGPITAPRWMHHVVVKLCAQHTAPAFLLWVFTGRPLLATLIAGPGMYALILARKLWYRHRPNVPDWIHDGAIATTPVAGGLMASGNWIGGALLLGACASTWMALHRRAIP